MRSSAGGPPSSASCEMERASDRSDALALWAYPYRCKWRVVPLFSAQRVLVRLGLRGLGCLRRLRRLGGGAELAGCLDVRVVFAQLVQVPIDAGLRGLRLGELRADRDERVLVAHPAQDRGLCRLAHAVLGCARGLGFFRLTHVDLPRCLVSQVAALVDSRMGGCHVGRQNGTVTSPLRQGGRSPRAGPTSAC